jgi:predicted Zn-dependent protease
MMGIAYVVLEFPFSRMIELEADSVGMTLAAGACFDLTNVTSVWTKLADAQPWFFESLSTHPLPETRMVHMQERMEHVGIIHSERGCFSLPE